LHVDFEEVWYEFNGRWKDERAKAMELEREGGKNSDVKRRKE